MTDSKSKRMRYTLDSTWPDTKNVRLSDEQVDALIEQLHEITQANLDLITEAEMTRAESALTRKRSTRLQWFVSIAFMVGCFVAIAMFVHIRSATEQMRRDVATATDAFNALDKNVSLTLEVVRTLSEAQAAKVVAEVDMDAVSEAKAKRKADEAQRKAIEAETKIQKDPAKKAKAENKLRDLDENGDLTK